MEIPYDDLFDKYNVNESDSTIIVRALDQGDENVYALIRNPNTNGGTLTYDNESVSLSLYAAKMNGDRQTKNKFARFLAYDAQEVGDPTAGDTRVEEVVQLGRAAWNSSTAPNTRAATPPR